MKDLCVPVALISILASMLLPLPPTLLDFLIVGNLGLSLLLLVSSLYITDALKLSALPTLLLVATLYRLSLNVASTRLILGSGEAGHVIKAFGAVVIGGNLVVGAVIFLVITLIQFMVIAKGSERVAEVAARFTLDALPGKQMSIDADVRAGLIDFETARKRRQEMQTESRFYGALDGAMKFVKGDAIAGIIIAMINITGGFAIGLLVEDLEVHQAISKYTLLTIGDGLVSQLPALLSALAAGIVVTRVSRGDGATVSQELFSQLGQIKAAKYLIAIFCLVIMFIPGMPLIPFTCLAIILSTSAMFMKEKAAPKVFEARFEPRRVPLIEIRLNKELASHFAKLPDLRARINAARNDIYEESGVLLLAPEFHASESLRDSFEVWIRGAQTFKDTLLQDKEAALDQILRAYCSCSLSRKTELIDDIFCRRLLDFVDKDHPELVSSVVPGAISLTQLTEILKALTREDVSLRQLELILQGIAESTSKSEGSRLLLEDVRVTLGRTIVNRFINTRSCISCLVLDAVLDATLVQSERSGLALPTNAIKSLAEELDQTDLQDHVILTSKGARALLRDCLLLRRIKVPLLAHEEIPEDIKIEVTKIIGAGDIYETEDLIKNLAA